MGNNLTDDEPISVNTDATLTITIDDISEDAVYEWLYREPLWPDTING